MFNCRECSLPISHELAKCRNCDFDNSYDDRSDEDDKDFDIPKKFTHDTLDDSNSDSSSNSESESCSESSSDSNSSSDSDIGKPRISKQTKKQIPNKSKPKNDPNRISRPKNAYICFVSDEKNRSDIKKISGDTKLNPRETMRNLAALWKLMSKEDRKPYRRMAKADKLRFIQKQKEQNLEKKKNKQKKRKSPIHSDSDSNTDNESTLDHKHKKMKKDKKQKKPVPKVSKPKQLVKTVFKQDKTVLKINEDGKSKKPTAVKMDPTLVYVTSRQVDKKPKAVRQKTTSRKKSE